MNRSTRIILLLVIDVLFFFVELIVGYAVGSLALVADSFHMLNDVMSLAVALYAIKLTNQTHTDSRYSYGWHRAEILAALINGVFLLALCFSIFLEAVERFFSTPEISNPRLVVLVGSLGLASNIVGLFLFHEHGHDHGHGKESHPLSKPSSVRSNSDAERVPQAKVTQPKKISSTSRARSDSESSYSLYGHPAATRASMVQAAQEIASARSPSPVGIRGKSRSRRSRSRPGQHAEESDHEETLATSSAGEAPAADENTPLLTSETASSTSDSHSEHDKHTHGKGKHGHSHGSMNMRALLLHVLGDALGNVGVIATGLVIWRTTWSFKYYFDPIISLVITVIIFSSALPLVRSTSFILLQGVPSTIDIEDVKEAILAVDGVLSLHELHVWQLSESKIVASVHVMASRNHDFMPVAAEIRKALHHQGIHSSTIQPEYHNPRNSPPEEHLKTSEETSCLILCPPDEECNPSENACCPPPPVDV
ncbi:zinc/cadmium resistance protein [Laetiporus sulphureus 93-53]|uniref:Zinc/cadmium resistance protein n=1 Tax=Laetiporus sulphureus 93-53 TaxID=1314785 RepID=A0A165DZC2_9APHY|nr:zinc/cadmium resistance protein [Laetiporus sulphureus 93-53]KZT05945.1 zinc/cadmium resistance protein [Laetiporus sulphureus 93-53]